MDSTTPAAWYALRRTLPPWRFDELLTELAELAPQFKIDEVIIKIDTEDFSHGHPDVAWAEAYQVQLMQVKQTLDKLGIVYSLNPWITVGHCDRGRDDREKMPELGIIVGHDGSETKHCACPLSTVWRERVTKLWTIYAETKQHIMWIEDDIRTFNHEPVRFGCFCDRHMELFSQRVGEKVDRETLVEAMLRPGDPHPWRAEYMAMQREIMIETAGWLGKLVHRTSPDTCMGLMSSGPRQHCLEGRDWIRFGEALADGKPLYSRLPMGGYNEVSMRDNYYSHDSIKLTRHVMPKGAIEQTEVENIPYTRYSKEPQLHLYRNGGFVRLRFARGDIEFLRPCRHTIGEGDRIRQNDGGEEAVSECTCYGDTAGWVFPGRPSAASSICEHVEATAGRLRLSGSGGGWLCDDASVGKPRNFDDL